MFPEKNQRDFKFFQTSKTNVRGNFPKCKKQLVSFASLKKILEAVVVESHIRKELSSFVTNCQI